MHKPIAQNKNGIPTVTYYQHNKKRQETFDNMKEARWYAANKPWESHKAQWCWQLRENCKELLAGFPILAEFEGRIRLEILYAYEIKPGQHSREWLIRASETLARRFVDADHMPKSYPHTCYRRDDPFPGPFDRRQRATKASTRPVPESVLQQIQLVLSA